MQQIELAIPATARCLHCGSPILSGKGLYCCVGCEFVHRSITGHGLQSYYKMLTSSGSALKPAAVAPNIFQYADSPEFIESFTAPATAPGRRKLTLYLDGVHCAACVWILERIPELISGVSAAELRFARGELLIEYSEDETNPAEILTCVNSLGYRPTPIRLDAGEIARARSNRVFLMRIGVAGVCAMNIMMLAVSLYQGAATGIEPHYRDLFSWVSLALCLPVVGFSAVPLYRTAIGGLRSGVLHIDLPISLAIAAGFVLSAVNTLRGDFDIYYDSISALVVLLLVGRWIQHRTIERASDAHALLYSVVPRFATQNGAQVFIESLRTGDIISVKQGDTLSIDGIIQRGFAEVSTAFLTGESHPVQCAPGEPVCAGSKVISGNAEIRITALGSETRLGKIMEVVERAGRSKAPLVQFLDRCSRGFTGAVLILALFTFVFWAGASMNAAFENSLALLVVTCPCVLAFATPLTFSLAVSRAARSGILFRGAEALERTAELSSVVFDKTGTITRGELALQSVTLVRRDAPEALADFRSFAGLEPRFAAAIAAIEIGVEHPVASALRSAAAGNVPAVDAPLQAARTIHPGRGVESLLDGSPVAVGSIQFIRGKLTPETAQAADSAVSAIAGRGGIPVAACRGPDCAAIFEFHDPLRPEAREVIRTLRAMGVKIYLLSGDHSSVVSTVAREVGIPADCAFAERSPEEKMEIVAEIERSGRTAMVGDGVNDAAAWKSASVGIGLHGGAELALKLTDIFLANQDLMLVPKLIAGARRTLRTVKRSLFISAAYNVLGGAAAMTGMLGPLGAAILMPLSSLSVLGLAISTRSFRK